MRSCRAHGGKKCGCYSRTPLANHGSNPLGLTNLGLSAPRPCRRRPRDPRDPSDPQPGLPSVPALKTSSKTGGRDPGASVAPRGSSAEAGSSSVVVSFDIVSIHVLSLSHFRFSSDAREAPTPPGRAGSWDIRYRGTRARPPVPKAPPWPPTRRHRDASGSPERTATVPVRPARNPRGRRGPRRLVPRVSRSPRAPVAEEPLVRQRKGRRGPGSATPRPVGPPSPRGSENARGPSLARVAGFGVRTRSLAASALRAAAAPTRPTAHLACHRDRGRR